MRFLFAGAAAAALAFAAPAFAQDTVVIAPEQETVIKEYVTKKPVASIDLPGIELNVGTALPETVELYEVEDPSVTYSYTVVGGRTVVVDPGTRKVVKVLD